MASMRVIPLLLAFLAAAANANVYSCGGFVKSDVSIDYSKIKVKLLTPEGNLRHEESVNAVNGYYMIPVYTKGSYSIRVSAPEGWFFEPSTFDFKLDGSTDKCSLEEDINFALSAFSIEGAVQSQDGEGPAGLKLELLKDGSAIASTTTVEGGGYRFQAPPGKYTVSTEKGADVCISHSASHVEVKNAPVKVEPALKISGYPVTIKVSSPNGSPLKDTEINMFSISDPKLPSCRPIQSGDHAITGNKVACPLGKTDAKGEVQISCLAPAVYHVRPAADGLTFSPDSGVLRVEKQRVSLSFSVNGFTASGRVLAGGKPRVGVEVLVDGKKIGVTDSAGSYSVTGLKDGQYSVTAREAHTSYSTHNSLTLSSTKRSIPDIVVEGFDICGLVESDAEGAFETLTLAPEDKPKETKSIRPDAKGKFCQSVPPGKYTIGPVSSDSSLAPSSTVVDVSSRPETSLQFTHFKTDAEVKFTCIGPCDSITLALRSARTGATVSTAKGIDHFVFKDVSPGKYLVGVPEGSRACWEKEELTINVGQEEPKPAHFVQSGFNAQLSLSHPATIDWQHVDQKAAKGSIKGSRGINSLCLPAAGGYKIQVSSCMVFDRPSLSLTVPSDARLETYAVSAAVSGRLDGAVPGTKIAVSSKSGEREITVDAAGAFSFQEPLTSASHKIVLTPLSSTHLFTPVAHSFLFDGECEKNVVVFEGVKGIFIDGSVSPPVEGVEVEAVNKKDKTVLKTTTDKDGKYRIGPIRRAEDMEIKATKDGYTFLDGAKHGDLKSVKLSQLTLTFEDKITKEKLDDVMLYVRDTSGEKKTHHKVDESGIIKLVALTPGTFIRPILQEYSFDPSTITVATKEGEHEEKTIHGARMAYSAFGVVREMSGAPLSELKVEALSEKCDQHQLEALTKPDGSFRVRALKPGCSYKIGVSGTEKGTAAPHCFPSSFTVKMTDKDVKGLEMVAAPMDEGMELLVDVNVVVPLNTMRPGLRITLLRDGHNQVAMQTIPSPVSVMTLRQLARDGANYVVRVEADRSTSASSLSFPPVETSFVADSPVQVINLTLAPSKSATEVEISKSSIVAFVLFGLLALFILNPQEWMERLRYISEYLQKLQQSSGSSSPSQSTNKKRK